MAKTAKIIDGTLVKIKHRGGVKEIPESYDQRQKILRECHDRAGHRGLDATLALVNA
jgi:hypothetical protein